ncbi:MAG: 30S ribosomal protein S6 [Candidatus Jorgensenbacteria bacterium]
MESETNIETTPRFEISYLEREEGTGGLRAAIERNHGRVIAEKPLEKVRLAYPIRKHPYAFLGCIEFSMEPSLLAEFRAELNLNSEVLRILLHRATRPEASTASESPKFDATPRVRPPRPARPKADPAILTNEALEKKIEEILK